MAVLHVFGLTKLRSLTFRICRAACHVCQRILGAQLCDHKPESPKGMAAQVAQVAQRYRNVKLRSREDSA